MSDRPKTIFKSVKNKDNPYVMIDRRLAENSLLSWKAKGILTYLLSRPDDWEINIADLCNRSTDRVASVRSGLKELFGAGHCKYERLRNEKMQITEWRILVFEVPLKHPDPENPEAEADLDSDFHNVGADLECENLQCENLQVGNRTQVIKELSNKELNDRLGAQPAPATPPEVPKPTPTQSADLQVDLSARVAEYPEDCQQTLLWLVDLFHWLLAAIPARPSPSAKGGPYAQWINEIRAINKQIAGYGQSALEAAFQACAHITVSHPAAITWCLAGEVGKLSKKAEAAQKQRKPTPLEELEEKGNWVRLPHRAFPPKEVNA